MNAGLFGFTDASIGGNHKLSLPTISKLHAMNSGCRKIILQ